MRDAEIVDDYFRALIRRPETTWSENDRAIYLVVAARCEMDMDGFDNVFNQLLKKADLQLLLGSLRRMGEPNLAQSFQDAHDRLESVRFFEDDSLMLWDLADEESETGFLDDIERKVRENDKMWQLDRKLVSLIPNQAD